MAITVVRGATDANIDALIGAFRRYEADHPQARIDLYRTTPVTVNVRVIDPDLAAIDPVDRHEIFWRYLDGVPDDAVEDLHKIVIVTPDEVPTSVGSFSFDHPLEPLFSASGG